MKLLITCGHLIRAIDKFAGELSAKGVSWTIPEIPGQQLDAAGMLAALPGHDLVIAGDDFIDRETIAAAKAKGLKAIIKWGIGTDAVDKVAAKELGIPVYNTPGVFSDEVADMAAGYVVMLARALHSVDRRVHGGEWAKHQGYSLSGKTAGVVGLGGIGRAAVRRLAAFGMNVIGFDPYPVDAAALAAVGGTQVPLDDLLERSDFIVVTCALTETSHHLIREETLAKTKPGVFLVNVARGPVVSEKALVAALQSGHVAGAALDVFEIEPLPADSRLHSFDNVIFGAHNGSNTREAVARVNRLTVDLALDLFGLTGQPPRLQPLVAA